MLQTLRDIGNKRIVRLIFALFLVVPFGFFGIDYYFKTPVGGDVIASVGSQRIGQVEFDNAIRQQAEMYRQQFRGQFDASLMNNPEMRRAVLDRLVNQKLVGIAADREKVRMGDKDLAMRIASEPSFQLAGTFNKDRYEAIAKANNLTVTGLDERLRREYAETQFRNSITETGFVPKAVVDAFIRLSEQTREVSVVNLTTDQYLAQVTVKPEDVKAFYDAHKADYTIPERVRVEYVELSLDALAAKFPVKPEDVKAVYEDQLKAGKLGQPEERRASHILIAVPADAKDDARKAAEAKATAIAAQVKKNPASFADVAKKESADPGSAVQGGDLGFFRRGAMVKAFEDAAFSAKKNDIVGPVKSEFGYHVIKVTEIKEGKTKSLAEAAPEIEAELKKQAASRSYADVAEQFTNMVYEQSTSLKPVAEKLNLTLKESPFIQKGAGAPAPLNNPKLQAEIFSDSTMKGKRNTSAVEIAPNMFVAARLIESKPAELSPFDQVKGGIEKRMQREQAAKLAVADGAAKLKNLQAGKDAGVKWPPALGVNRQKPGGLFPQVIEGVFRADAKKLPAFVGVETQAGYSLVQVSKVVEPEKIDEKMRDALGSQLRDAVAAEELDATLASLRDKVGVKVSRDALEAKPQPQ